LNRHVIGLFYDPDHSRKAIAALVDAGVGRGEISMMTAGSQACHFEPLELAVQANDGVDRSGIGLGATLIEAGNANGGVLAIGPLLVALASFGFGTSVDGIVGALVAIGLPEQEARFYELQVVERQAALIGVATLRHNEARIASIIHCNRAANLTRPG
jgi:hypothetical protein